MGRSPEPHRSGDMAYRLTVSARAAGEIGEAYEWYEGQLAGLGAGFLEALDVQFKLISETPTLCVEVRRGVRRALVAHFPYGVFYASKGEIVSVLAVVHTARSTRRWPRRP